MLLSNCAFYFIFYRQDLNKQMNSLVRIWLILLLLAVLHRGYRISNHPCPLHPLLLHQLTSFTSGFPPGLIRGCSNLSIIPSIYCPSSSLLIRPICSTLKENLVTSFSHPPLLWTLSTSNPPPPLSLIPCDLTVTHVFLWLTFIHVLSRAYLHLTRLSSTCSPLS